MINWDEVKVGETEIVDGFGDKRLVIGMHANLVWTKGLSGGVEGNFCIWRKQEIESWTIYDPWEEITEECIWEPIPGSVKAWMITHAGDVVLHDDLDYKTDGRRVWKRKEG